MQNYEEEQDYLDADWDENSDCEYDAYRDRAAELDMDIDELMRRNYW